MATEQNNNNRNPKRNPKIPNSQPGKRRRRKEKVPGAVIMIYILMILLVLSICALIFVITLNNTGWNGRNPGEDESLELSVSANNSTSTDPESSSEQSSLGQSDSNISGESSDISLDSDSSNDNSSSSGSNSSSNSVDVTFLPTDFDAEFFDDDLFIGDSIFTGLYLYGHLDQANVAAAVGYTPYKAMHSVFNAAQYNGSATDYAAERKPKRIFVMLGSNTMAAGTNYDVIVTQYETMLTSLKQNCPGSDICVISIPPVTSDSSAAASAKINNSDIISVNDKLKKMAVSTGVEYFDLNGMLSDENGYFMKDYAEMDGLHFKGVTYKVLLSVLQKEFT